ncbi:MAG: B12-binding domain-containing protein [Anaerolineales bacterium]
MTDILNQLQDALYEGRKNDVEKLTREALSGGIDPLKIIEDGLRAGLSRVGEDFERKKYLINSELKISLCDRFVLKINTRFAR